ncbi:MAG TPA: hypothetical protein VGN44_02130 [Candidatus Angelobacter sp.]
MVIAVVIVCAQSYSAQTKTASSTVNLRDFGWEPPEQINLYEANSGSRLILLDHKGQILVGFATRERDGSATPDHPALSFHVIRFTPDGKVNLSLSLPTNGWRDNGVYLSDTDQIIVRANDKLQLLQSGANAENASWTMISPCALRCRIIQSPDRRTLLVGTWDVNPPATVLDLSRFPTAQRCENPPTPYSIDSITDKFAYHTGVNRQLEHFTSRWPLCDYEQHVELPVHILGRYTVLNDEFFITNVDEKADKYTNSHLHVVSFEGRLKFRQAMAKHEFWANWFVPIRSSEHGTRIAVDIITIRGVNRILDLSGHITARKIAVYDIDTGKQLVSIPVNKKHYYRYEFDFSPDGRRLAILEDDLVKVVDIE